MPEFWETAFRDKQEMWGSAPSDSALSASTLFKQYGLNKILIPGFGYGRNAGVFIDNGCEVTGIEISQTAIDLAKKHHGEDIKVYHGSVGDMPFDREVYDGIFCYALIHLLRADERLKLIKDCYHQLRPGGYMVFAAISKTDSRYGDGTEISKDTFETRHGVVLFFYDADSVKAEFGNYGLIDAEEMDESSKNIANRHSQIFWQILCRKEAAGVQVAEGL